MKRCRECQEVKPTDAFGRLKRSKDGTNPVCKDCKQSYFRNLYATSPERREAIKTNDQVFRARNHARYIEYKKTLSCIDCGISDYRVLDFDHLDGKGFNIADKAWTMSFESLLVEIEKCEVRCANCHRILTHTRRELEVSHVREK